MILTNNRGMFLESLINYTIEYYQKKEVCLIYKRPVDIVCTKTENGKIISGYFKGKSTCDYYGIYDGSYFEFEAKETHKDKFPLANLHQHQLLQLKLVAKHHGISFLVVYFAIHERYFILPTSAIIQWINEGQSKQIPIDYFIEKGYEVFISYPGILDFSKIFNQLTN